MRFKTSNLKVCQELNNLHFIFRSRVLQCVTYLLRHCSLWSFLSIKQKENNADRVCITAYTVKKKFQFSKCKSTFFISKITCWLTFVQTFHDFSQLLTNRTFQVGNISPAMWRGIDSRSRVWNWVAKLQRLAGRYDNPMPPWFLAHIAGLESPTLESGFVESSGMHAVYSALKECDFSKSIRNYPLAGVLDEPDSQLIPLSGVAVQAR